MIIGNSPEILKIKKQILNLKASREPVLVQGEPGTGKELVARALHFHSDRRHRPFVKMNLAKLDSSMLNEFFFETLPGNCCRFGTDIHGSYICCGLRHHISGRNRGSSGGPSIKIAQHF